MLKYLVFILMEDYQTNTYLIWDEQSLEGLLLDPSKSSSKVLDKINELNIKIKYIVNTHGHFDHIGGNEYFSKKLNSPIAIGEYDAELLTSPQKNLSMFCEEKVISPEAKLLLKDRDIINLGKESLKILFTPGHSKGAICLLHKNLLFAGDTIFQNSIGRTDLPGGNYKNLINSIEKKIYSLPDDVFILTGHGNPTSVKHEKRHNPFVKVSSL